MSLAIAGMGWVTPLGNGVDPVWEQLLQGYEATDSKNLGKIWRSIL